jgi:hypothetical protein
MAKPPRPTGTPLLDWVPPEVAPKFEEITVRSVTMRGRISKAVATCLRECGLERDEVAQRMGDYLGEAVSVDMLNNYASEAKEDQNIPVIRLIALAKVTDDPRLFTVLTEGTGYCVIPERYRGAIEEVMIADKIEELEDRRKLARRTWRGAR